MEYRLFHIADLPQSILCVRIDTNYAPQLFAALADSVHSDVSAAITRIGRGTFKRWAESYFKRSGVGAFVKLDCLLHLAALLEKRGESWVSPSELERHIEAIRGYGASGILKHPRLPIREDEYLVRLLVHMLGDGHLPRVTGTQDRPNYTNGNAFLRSQFRDCMFRVFGDVTGCLHSYIDRAGKSRSNLTFPNWIGCILREFYPDAQFGQMEAALPAAFFSLPLKLKAVAVRTFGDDDGHVGAHSIRFVSGAKMILEQLRRLVLELMQATLHPGEFSELTRSVGRVAAFRSWFIFDLYRPLYHWFSEVVGLSHPERSAALAFQLACDAAHRERAFDGFDLDFLALVGLRDSGSVESLARRFLLREDFLFRAVLRLRRLGWVKRVGKQRYITLYRTSSPGEAFLAKTLRGAWALGDRVVVSDAWLRDLREALLKQFGNAAAASRAAGLPQNTVGHYLKGGRQVMSAMGLVTLARLVGWDRAVVSRGVVAAFDKRFAPRYEQCDFLCKVLPSYEQFSLGAISFQDWLLRRVRPVTRERHLLAVDFARKLQTADVIRRRILSLTEEGRGEVSLLRLTGDAELRELVADRYQNYLADRMAKLVQQGVFTRLARGRYRLAASNPQFVVAT